MLVRWLLIDKRGCPGDSAKSQCLVLTRFKCPLLIFRGNHGRGGTDEFKKADRYAVIQPVIPARHGPVRGCAVAKPLGTPGQATDTRKDSAPGAVSRQPTDTTGGMRSVCRLSSCILPRLWSPKMASVQLSWVRGPTPRSTMASIIR